MLDMQSIREQYALPTLLGSSRHRQFVHDVEKTPSALAEIKASKWAVPESFSPIAKKKLPKAVPHANMPQDSSPVADALALAEMKASNWAVPHANVPQDSSPVADALALAEMKASNW